MKIETQNDWNTVLAGCGCCTMPVCPEPTREIVYKGCGHALPAHPDVPAPVGNQPRYTRKNVVVTSSYSWTLTSETGNQSESGSGNHEQNWIIQAVDRVGEIDVWDCVDSYSGSGSESYNYNIEESPWQLEENGRGSSNYTITGDSYVIITGPPLEPVYQIYVDGESCTYQQYPPDPEEGGCYPFELWQFYGAIEPDEDWTFISPSKFTRSESIENEGWEGSGSVTYTVEYLDPEPEFFRWVISDTHKGSYFKITWDWVFIPDSGPPRYLDKDRLWVWEGPGDPYDEKTWKSNLFEKPKAPEGENGTVEIANVRYVCYRSTSLGVKPQVIPSTVYEIPE